MNKENNKKVVLSGIRASGTLHLGNYLGAVKGMLELSENPSYETFYMVADVHAITTPYDVKALQKDRINVILDYLAAGLNPDKSTIFVQSMVGAHAELAFYLSSVETVARMQHLPTYKDKVKQFPENSTMALLNYPILMASDILLYKADEVPVGKDQEPHLEIAREVARKMNEVYGTSFPEPQVHKTVGYNVPSLSGEGKMSKSVEGSYIALTDSLEAIKDRLARVATDSGKGEILPTSGSIANLLSFVELFQSVDLRKEYEQSYLSTGLRYKDLKESLATSIFELLQPIQEKRREIEKDMSFVSDVIYTGAKKAALVAENTLREVKEKMGFDIIP